MKLRVMLVDDEPFILQGLSVLINWEAEGCEIVKKAANGREAYDYLLGNGADLVIADIRMPVMTGLELLKKIREEGISDAYFIILSGYHDFKYAQQAIRYSCMDYILKPVQKEMLLEQLRNAVSKKKIDNKEEADSKRMQRVFLIQNLLSLLHGRQEPEQLNYVKNHMRLSKELCYVHISLDQITLLEELSDDELEALQKKLFDNCVRFLGEDSDHLMKDMIGYEEDYEIGFLYCGYMAAERGVESDAFLKELLSAAQKELEAPVILLVGKRVEDISKLSHSYSSACVLRSFKGFRASRSIYYYEEEVQVDPESRSKAILCKQSLDRLLQAVEQNDRNEINKGVDELFQEMKQLGMAKEMVSMNTNYLLFQLTHLAVEQDEDVNQEEVLLYISEHVFDSGIARGSRAHMRRFACEYAEYLVQLRKNVSRGVLLDIEKEIKEHYAQNLTLRELSQKYFVNSSYLGQIFRKKYGQSFKDYLCCYRINEAAGLLLRTDRKISRIAEDVGYRDTDYFISRFIEQKGTTPARYRKNAGSVG